MEQVCRRAIVINHGEIILDAPVERLKRDYLKAKTVELLLKEPATSFVKVDTETGVQRLSVQSVGTIHEELQDIAGVRLLKVDGFSLKLEIDTSQTSLEPVIGALMRSIVDMTITDPPMEEIIAAIYNEKEAFELDTHEPQEKTVGEEFLIAEKGDG